MKKFFEISAVAVTILGVSLLPVSALSIALHDSALTGALLIASLPTMLLGAWMFCKATELD